MTLNYGIFDSADPASPDRTYTATLLSRIVSKYLKNGIITGDLNEMAVTATDPPAMSVTVGTGTAIVQGRFCENDEALTLSVPTAHSTYPRIDRVVVRLSAVSGRSVDVVVVAGTPAASPVSPTLTQTSETWEIPLAQIAVGAGVTSILTANITDERVFPDMTNLFKAAVTMMSNLTVGGDIETIGALDVGGDLDVGGTATYGGAVTFEGGLVSNLTGLIYANYSIKDEDAAGALTIGKIIPAVNASLPTSTSDLVVTIIDGLQAILAAKTALPSVHTIIKPTGCNYPFDIVVNYGVGFTNATLGVVASDINGITLKSWGMTGADGSIVCDIPAGTDKIVATVHQQGATNTKSCSVPAYYATFSP